MNRIELHGQLSERKPLRYTPAGVPVTEARVVHASEQMEAGLARKVECEIAVLALGDTARWLQAAPLASELRLCGFLAARSQHSRSLVLHVQQIEFLEGK